MNKIEVFKNEEFGEIRTVIINGEPWFVGKDIAVKLGYSDPKDAIRKHVDIEDKQLIQKGQIATLEIPNRGMNIINESGLYALIFSSKLESANHFKHWVTGEVLPAIRKHGMYATEDLLNDPDLLIAMATELKNERRARKLAEQEKELANRKIEEQRPLVDFANKVSDSSNLIDMGKMAKLLKDEHINIGRNRLFEWLRRKEILMKNNMPYQRYIDVGYFQVKESVYETPYGTKTQQTTKITGKGQIYITEKLRKEFGAV